LVRFRPGACKADKTPFSFVASDKHRCHRT
jgi:hypothetical protein